MPEPKTTEDPPIYECDCCGACCKTFTVRVTAEDAEREPRIKSEGLEIEPWMHKEGWRYILQPLPFLDGCCFLQSNGHCGVYETRPSVCREFQAGIEACQTARSAFGLPPLEPKGPRRP